MNKAEEDRIRKRLSWIEDLRPTLLLAVGDDKMLPTLKVIPTADPLRFLLRIVLLRPLEKTTRSPLRSYLRAHARENGCALPTIRITDRVIQAELLIKHRHWEKDSLENIRKKQTEIFQKRRQ